MLMRPHPQQIVALERTSLRAALWACAGSLGLAFAYSCGYNLLLFGPSIYLLQIYDRVLSSRSADTLVMLTLIVALIVVVGGLLDALRRAALGRIGGWLEDRLRPAVLAACFDYRSRADPAVAAEAYRDVTSLRQFVESSACPMLFDLLWAPLFLGVLFLVHPLLGTIAAASALLLFGLALAGELITEGPNAQYGAALARSYGRLSASMGNIHVIRAIGMMEGAARLIYQDARAARSALDTAQRRNEIVMLVGKPVRALAQVLVMGAAAWLVLQRDRSPAIIFAASLLFGRTLAPIEGAIAGWKAFAMALAVCRRLSSALTPGAPIVSSSPNLPKKPEGRVTVDNITVTLPSSGYYPLKDVSFSLAPGECLGIIGPSGSGKSTLARIIAGVSSPTKGRVLVDGIDISVLRDSLRGQHLGYLPQEIEIVGDTIKDIIARLNEADPMKVIKAARLAGLHEAIVRLPHGYDTVISQGDPGLLRAYRQRLGLARALFGDPCLVVLDEPNASLDYLGELALNEAVERMKAANITVIITTHRMGILATTNKIALLQQGTLWAFGDSQEIFDKYVSRPQVASRERSDTSPSQDGEPSDDNCAQPIMRWPPVDRRKAREFPDQRDGRSA